VVKGWEEGWRRKGGKGRWDSERAAYRGHADLVAVGDVGVGCERAGLCDGVAEGWGEEVEEGEGQGSYEDAVDHCEGWVLDYWVMWMKGIWK
jgi:hypothetical protein